MATLINFEKYYDNFRDISRIVHASIDVAEVLELVVWKTAEMFAASSAFVRIINLKTQQSECAAAWGLEDAYLLLDPLSDHLFIKELIQSGKSAVVTRVDANPRVKGRRYLQEKGIQSLIDIPLALREDIYGIIRIYLTHPIALSDAEMGFIGAVSETCACAIDKARMIEEQKNQYTQLALQTEKLSALGRMAAGIAHEINNPLAGILLFSTNLLKKHQAQGQLTEGLEIIIGETQRCKGIILSLLEFSRDKAPSKLAAGINTVIEAALTILNNEFRLHHIAVEKDLFDDLPQLHLDTSLMQQVFVNLLMNAIEAIGDDGKIRIRSALSPNRACVRIEIADTGRGISKDHLGKIFDPFFSTKKSGTGLGLAVTYGIIQKHDGHIRVSSEPEKGTCFTIDIPISDKPTAC
jgi:two-component system, NtrC family, sensor kinase